LWCTTSMAGFPACFKAGDEVYARPRQDRIGTFAEFIAMNENDVAMKPKALTMEQAASIPLVGLTAWQALIERGELKKAQKVFIQAGSGGVGTFAIQLAKHVGATVATTTSMGNVELVKSLGADIVIDYKKQDFESLLRDYDVVLNSQDKVTLEKSLTRYSSRAASSYRSLVLRILDLPENRDQVG
jgi:NADPH:quinone reductase-like Zn-dependent oxidoreductase